jgi:hypothetical protein
MSSEDLTPGEQDVLRINQEKLEQMQRGEITQDKRHLLRSTAAIAHIEKVNREAGVETPPRVYDEHSKGHETHRLEPSFEGQQMTSSEKGPSESTGTSGASARGGRATGASGFGSSEVTKDIAGKSTISEETPLEDVPAQFGGTKLTGAAKMAHEAKLAREAAEERKQSRQ